MDNGNIQGGDLIAFTKTNTTHTNWRPRITDGSSVGQIAGIVDLRQRGDSTVDNTNHYYNLRPWYPWYPYTPWVNPITVTPLPDYETQRAAKAAEKATKELKDEVASLKESVEKLSARGNELTKPERAALDLLLGVNTGNPEEYARVLTAVKILLGL